MLVFLRVWVVVSVVVCNGFVVGVKLIDGKKLMLRFLMWVVFVLLSGIGMIVGLIWFGLVSRGSVSLRFLMK